MEFIDQELVEDSANGYEINVVMDKQTKKIHNIHINPTAPKFESSDNESIEVTSDDASPRVHKRTKKFTQALKTEEDKFTPFQPKGPLGGIQ